ncbi:unnamed protein product [Urochloa decumbens]|uniref:Uncharacterized protein n=1 Tax=Urochloa decumbens TaxID=240449 RepID=A0ABC9EKU2_9POAL
MAARTLAVAAGGRARAAAAALGARLQPLAPPLGRRFPCPAPAPALLSQRAPPLLGPRGPGAGPPRLRPLAPAIFHPLAFSFSSDSTAKGVGGQDPGQGGDGGAGEEKRNEGKNVAIDAGAKKPSAAVEDPKKPLLSGEGDAFTAGDVSKKQSPGDGGEMTEVEAARALDAEAKNGANKPDGAAAAEEPKKPHLSGEGDAFTAGDVSKKQPPGDGSEKTEEEVSRAFDAGAKNGANKPPDAAAAADPKTHLSGEDPTAGEISEKQLPGDEGEKMKGESALAIDAGGKKTYAAAGEVANKLTGDGDLPAILKALLKEHETSLLKEVEGLLDTNSATERKKSRITRNNQTLVILGGVFLEIAIVGAVGFMVGIRYAVEEARDKLHEISGDQKTKEIMHNLYGTAFGYIGQTIASPVMVVGRAAGAGGRRVSAAGRSIGLKLGLVKVSEEGAMEDKVEAFSSTDVLLIWCP